MLGPCLLVTPGTQPGGRPSDDKPMRWFLAIGLLATWWAWHEPAGVDDAGEQPEGASVAAAADNPLSLLPTALEPLWTGAAAPAPAASDPVVLCRLAGEQSFVRRSDCEIAGGDVDEPAWASLP